MALLVVVAVAIARLHHLFAAVMLASLYSLLCAAVFVAMDAVDVAFTEAAVGAGISTVLMVTTLGFTYSKIKPPPRSRSWAPLLMVSVTGAAMVYGTFDLPSYGDPGAPAHGHVVPRYIKASPTEIGPPNIVTSVLASYRGYDTLGETVVIFTAGIGVIALLGRGRRRWPRKSED